MSHFESGPLAGYNSLQDKHLSAYHANTQMKKHLKKSGLITNHGDIVSENHYRLMMAKKEHRKNVKDMLATAIVHKALDMERMRHYEIRTRLDELYRIDVVQRVRAERAKKNDQQLVAVLSPRGSQSKKKRRHHKHMDENAETRLPSIHHDDAVIQKNARLKSYVERTPSVPDNMEEPSFHPRQPHPPSTRGRGKGRRLMKSEPAIAHKVQLQSMAEVTMKFLGSPLNLTSDMFPINRLSEVTLLQQHSGGSTLCVFREMLPPNTVFTFISRRHRGAPFGLTMDIDGLMNARISSCCEYKHRPGYKVGGKHSQFALVSVHGAAPCYKCQVRMNLIGRKGKAEKEVEHSDDSDAESAVRSYDVIVSRNAVRTPPTTSATASPEKPRPASASAATQTTDNEAEVKKSHSEGEEFELPVDEPYSSDSSDFSASDDEEEITKIDEHSNSESDEEEEESKFSDDFEENSDENTENKEPDEGADAIESDDDKSPSKYSPTETEDEMTLSVEAVQRPGSALVSEAVVAEHEDPMSPDERENEPGAPDDDKEDKISDTDSLTSKSSSDSSSDSEDDEADTKVDSDREEAKDEETEEEKVEEKEEEKEEENEEEKEEEKEEVLDNAIDSPAQNEVEETDDQEESSIQDDKAQATEATEVVEKESPVEDNVDEEAEHTTSEKDSPLSEEVTTEDEVKDIAEDAVQPDVQALEVEEVALVTERPSSGIMTSRPSSSRPSSSNSKKNVTFKEEVKVETYETVELPETTTSQDSQEDSDEANSAADLPDDADEEGEEMMFGGGTAGERIVVLHDLADSTDEDNTNTAADSTDDDLNSSEESKDDVQAGSDDVDADDVAKVDGDRDEVEEEQGPEKPSEFTEAEEDPIVSSEELIVGDGNTAVLNTDAGPEKPSEFTEAEEDPIVSSEELIVGGDGNTAVLNTDAGDVVDGIELPDSPTDPDPEITEESDPNKESVVLDATVNDEYTALDVNDESTALETDSEVETALMDIGHDPAVVAVDPEEEAVTKRTQSSENIKSLVVSNKEVELDSLVLSEEQTKELASFLEENEDEIESLSLRNTILEGVSREIFKKIEGLSKLKMLNLNMTNLKFEDMRYLRDVLVSDDCPIETLLLHGNPLGDAGIEDLVESLMSNTRVSSLNIGACGMEAAGASSLAAWIAQSEVVKELTLSENSAVTTEGWQALAEALAQNTSLRTLAVDFCQLGDDGCSAISSGIGRSALRSVDIEGNQITDEGGKSLAMAITLCSTLNDVTLMPQNQFSEEMEEQLRQALSGR